MRTTLLVFVISLLYCTNCTYAGPFGACYLKKLISGTPVSKDKSHVNPDAIILVCYPHVTISTCEKYAHERMRLHFVTWLRDKECDLSKL